MKPRRVRVGGVLSALGAVLSVVASIPAKWYGATSGDSYVFNPPLFSPPWIERTVVPVLAVLAGALLVVGVGALVFRDRALAGRLRRWSGSAALAGFAFLELAIVFIVGVTGSASAGGDELTELVSVLLGLASGALGVLLAVTGLVALGASYLRDGRRALGAALVVGPVASVAVVAIASLGVGSLPVAIVMGGVFLVVGHDLYWHPDPVADSRGPDAASDGTADAPASESESADAGNGKQ